MNPVMRIVELYEDHPIMERLDRREDPFRVLIRTIISQRTRDTVTRRVSERFFERFDGPEDVIEADLEEIQEILRGAGLYRQKARWIRACCERIVSEGIDLSEVVRRPVEEARETLLDLPGVGPKTADVVLLFAGGHDICPVDVHVRRIVGRLGLVDSRDYDDVQRAVHEAVPEGKRGKAHLALIQFGREICRSEPKCEACPVRPLCPTGGGERG